MSWQKHYPFNSHYLNTPSGRLHYIDAGDRNRPALMMLHGNPTWSFYWRNLIVELQKSFRVVAMDHMGCGLSDKNKNETYRLRDHIHHVELLVDHLKLQDIHLFVHDWGGAIGMGYATKHPDNISSLSVFNTAAFLSDRMPVRIALCRVPLLGKFLVQGLNGFVKAAFAMATEKGLSREVRAGYLSPYKTYDQRKATYDFVQDIPMNEKHPSYSTLKNIDENLSVLKDKPTHIFWGGKDWCFNQNFLQEWKKRFPKAQISLYPEAGHYVVEDAGSEILPVVKKFLQEVGAEKL